MSFLEFNDGVLYIKLGEILSQEGAFTPDNPENTITEKIFTIPVGHGIVGNVAVTGKSEINQNIAQDPRYIVDSNSGNSEITVPIFFNHKLIGIIDSESQEPDAFNLEHLQILEVAAKVCAPFLQRAILSEKNVYDKKTIASEVSIEKNNLIRGLNYLKGASQLVTDDQKASNEKTVTESKNKESRISFLSSLFKKHQRKSDDQINSHVLLFSEIIEELYPNQDLNITSKFQGETEIQVSRASYKHVLKLIISHTMAYSLNKQKRLLIASRLYGGKQYFFFVAQNIKAQEKYHVSATQESFFLSAAREILKETDGTIKIRKSSNSQQLTFSFCLETIS